MTPIIRVAVPSPLREALDYLPAREGPLPRPGSRVLVPLGPRRLVGVVVEIATESALPRARMRPILEVLDPEPLLPPDLLALGRWAADYYQHPPGEVFSQILPVAARRLKTARRQDNGWRLSADGRDRDAEELGRAPARRRALAALREGPAGGMTTAALDALGIRAAVLRTLAADGWVERVRLQELAAGAASADVPAAPRDAPLELGDEQARAVTTLRAALGGFGAFLLEGVTGSGKTEVYFAAMRTTLDAGRQVLMLVPEIGLTPQTLARIRARFAEPLAVLHSALADGVRLEAWQAAASGRARIIVGTRSAVFAPLPQAGLMIVDEEHDDSYKQQDGFRYSARDLAVKRARDLSIPVVLGSATPSLETLHNAFSGRYGHLRLSHRAGGARPPTHRLVDLNRHGPEEGISGPLMKAMEATLGRGEQVLVFLNRRGYAPVMMCHECHWIAECPRCDARLTVHSRPAELRCHHCGTRRPLPPTCPDCGAPEPMPVGLGTQRTEATLHARFPDTPVIRIDRDSTRSATALEATLERVAAGTSAILVGTQMITKGHHFPAVTLVAVIDADGGLFSADFRAGERLAQQMVQVAGRAGRAERPGEVIIQTRHPDHPLLQALVEQGYPAFAAATLAEREDAGFPPFGRLALIRAEAPDAQAPERFLDVAARHLRAAAGILPVQVLGPVPALMARRAGRYRAQLLLRADDRGPLHRLLAATLADLDALPEARRVRWSLDVDPQDTL
ncbi:MAG TPA: primosomal protein N' [Pseudomonadales bacterium]|nr:primosomal protein N' [Pseudomonadales bacterium]